MNSPISTFPIKIVIIGNCQARPLSKILKLLAPRIQIQDITITHLAQQVEADAKYEIYREADFIFAQLVRNEYFIEFVRTKKLKEEFGSKLIVWPNVFYRGQCPDLFYVTQAGKGRVIGPLGEYQNRIIFEAWQHAITVAEAVDCLVNADNWLDRLRYESERSLEELRSRDAECDIRIFPDIIENWREKRLFFTFNHPTQFLLTRLAEKLLKLIACEWDDRGLTPNGAEPLDPIIPALMPAIADHLQLKLATTTVSKGCELSFDECVKIEKRSIFYEPEQLVTTTYLALDLQLKRYTPVRFS